MVEREAVNFDVTGSIPVREVMCKILFLDDCKQRYHSFLFNNNKENVIIDWAKNADEAIELIGKNNYDYAFLDHDLGEKLTGYDFVLYLVKNKIKINGFVVCHSMNSVGRKNMISTLDRYGYRAYDVPVAWDKNFIFNDHNDK
jgi:hypothetical protein